jgi:glycosyltransferase involved in cell wall biosynthesis
MADRPLVSVVTPTWQRLELLAETLRHVREQDYPNIHHLIVSDGPDHRANFATLDAAERPVSVRSGGTRYAELGRNWSGLMPESFGIAPLTVGYLMARGDYIMNWSDDDRALSQSHISRR